MLTLSKTQQIYCIIALITITLLIIFYLNDKRELELKLVTPEEYDHLLPSYPQKLLNISFRYILNSQDVCESSEHVLAVFIVTSYFGNVETRSSMRRAFNAEKLKAFKLRRVFLLGEAPKDKYTTQKSIIDESRRFKDIIQGNFLEAYRNLTYKHVMGLKWAGINCKNAKYVVKMDDDTVVNMYMVQTLLGSLDLIHNRDFIAGYKLNKMKPIREPANKWYVTREEYSPSTYPTFVSGWFYVTNPQTARKLSIFANLEKYFWIDDVFVTGILANKLKVMLFDIHQYFVVNSEFLQCCLQDFDKGIDCDVYVGPNGGNDNMFFEFNEKVKKCVEEHGCVKRSKLLNETCVAERKVSLGKGDPIISDFRLK